MILIFNGLEQELETFNFFFQFCLYLRIIYIIIYNRALNLKYCFYFSKKYNKIKLYQT